MMTHKEDKLMRKSALKSLVAGFLVAFFALPVFALDQAFTIGSLANRITNIVTYASEIRSITIQNIGTVTNLNYAILDGFTNSASYPTFHILGVSNVNQITSVSYLTNITRLYTNNYTGVTNAITISNANYFAWSTNTTVAPWRVLYSGTVASNSSVTIVPSTPINAVYGIAFTNNNTGGGASLTLSWDPAF